MKKRTVSVIVASLLMVGLQSSAQNMALNVDGVDDYLEVFDSPSLDLNGPLTICAWYYFNPVTAPEPGLVQKDGQDSWGRYGVWLWDADKVDFCLFPQFGNQQCFTTSSGLKTNSWNHIAAVYNGISMEVFVNGISQGTRPFSSTVSTSDLSLFIGGDVSEARYVKGYIDEVSIWNVARTRAQIQRTMYDSLSSAYYSIPDSGLVAYYRFDQYEDLGVRSDGADDIRDFSVNANHGDSEGHPQLVPSTALTAVENTFVHTPIDFCLFQNCPNPFNPSTKIRFTVSDFGFVNLRIYDVLGLQIATLVNEEKKPGTYEVEFDASNLLNGKAGLSSGVYFYTLRVSDFVETKKMLLLR
jgi:hypothetical protein